MPVSRFTKINKTLYELDKGRGPVSIDLDALGISLGAAQVEKLRAAIQELLDVRVKVSVLSDDDPFKVSDPARFDSFWEGVGGDKDLVSRLAEVAVRWNGADFEILLVKPGHSLVFIDLVGAVVTRSPSSIL